MSEPVAEAAAEPVADEAGESNAEPVAEAASESPVYQPVQRITPAEIINSTYEREPVVEDATDETTTASETFETAHESEPSSEWLGSADDELEEPPVERYTPPAEMYEAPVDMYVAVGTEMAVDSEADTDTAETDAHD